MTAGEKYLGYRGNSLEDPYKKALTSGAFVLQTI